MQFDAGVMRVAKAELSTVIRAAHAQRISTYTLADVTDRDSFFDAVRVTLPLDPPLMSNRSWDAMIDSLGAGLAENKARSILIAWPDEGAWDPASLAERDIARDVLESAAERAGCMPPRAGGKRVTILIAS